MNYIEFLKTYTGENMTNKPNIAAKFAVAIAVSALALTGCSADNEREPKPASSQSQEQNKNLTAESAAEFAADYYATWFNSADGDKYELVNTEVGKIIGEDLNKVPGLENDPVGYFESLPEDKQEALVAKTTELNTNSDMYDSSNLSNAETIIMNVMVITLPAAFGSAESVTVSVNPEGVEVNGNEASVLPSGLVVKYGDSDTNAAESISPNEGLNLPLIGVDGEWKVDGKKFLDSILDMSTPPATEEAPANN